MFGDIIAPISKISGRDIMKQIILTDSRFGECHEPNLMDAVRISGELAHEKKAVINPDYLLSVWTELDKAGYTDRIGGATHNDNRIKESR